jgi:Mg2+-importing ATPase
LTTVLIVVAGVLLPYSALAGDLGFVPLPAAFFIFLTAATVTYLGLVELVKRRLVRQIAR